jgi:lysophospholipid acyltransferase (LPLAT)-like uncharacterized protein
VRRRPWHKRLLSSRPWRTAVRLAAGGVRHVWYGMLLYDVDPRVHGLMKGRDPALFGVLHQDFVQTVGYLSRWNARRRSIVLASGSRDGGMAAAAAEGIGFRHVVRGSSARGGDAALRDARRRLRRGRDEPLPSMVVVCDGPRPPARVVKPGIVFLARESGLPIWLLRTAYRPAIVLWRSWARFVLPLPGARAVFLADGPFVVPATATRGEMEAIRSDLERRLRALADRSEDRLGQPRTGSGS